MYHEAIVGTQGRMCFFSNKKPADERLEDSMIALLESWSRRIETTCKYLPYNYIKLTMCILHSMEMSGGQALKEDILQLVPFRIRARAALMWYLSSRSAGCCGSLWAFTTSLRHPIYCHSRLLLEESCCSIILQSFFSASKPLSSSFSSLKFHHDSRATHVNCWINMHTSGIAVGWCLKLQLNSRLLLAWCYLRKLDMPLLPWARKFIQKAELRHDTYEKGQLDDQCPAHWPASPPRDQQCNMIDVCYDGLWCITRWQLLEGFSGCVVSSWSGHPAVGILTGLVWQFDHCLSWWDLVPDEVLGLQLHNCCLSVWMIPFHCSWSNTSVRVHLKHDP